jgi:hypothetical protein
VLPEKKEDPPNGTEAAPPKEGDCAPKTEANPLLGVAAADPPNVVGSEEEAPKAYGCCCCCCCCCVGGFIICANGFAAAFCAAPNVNDPEAVEDSPGPGKEDAGAIKLEFSPLISMLGDSFPAVLN